MADRDLDVRTARAMGWTKLSIGPAGCLGYRPGSKMVEQVPGYRTDPAALAEMLVHLARGHRGVYIDVRAGSASAKHCDVTEYGATLFEAVARLVVACAGTDVP